MFSPLTKNLIVALKGLPGVGPKTAQRMAFDLLKPTAHSKSLGLAQALSEAIEHIHHCQQCRHYSEQPLCPICSDIKRQVNSVCVVETPADIVAIEQGQVFRGRYFVLHGHLSPLDGIRPQDLGIPQLIEQIHAGHITELILATNPTMEGRATASYIVNQLKDHPVSCTRLAQGVPVGGELEYLDSDTVSQAFHSRTPMERTHDL